MIYTITLNPALDYVLSADNFFVGQLNRSKWEKLIAGGKGINVSKVLTELKTDNTALGFVAGFTGAELERRLMEAGIATDFVHLLSGLTRINVKITGSQETEINADGPAIDEKSLNMLLQKLDKIDNTDYLVLAGSIPSKLPEHTYERILKKAYTKGCKIVVDTTGKKLMDSLTFKPFLIKPNHTELGELFNCRIDLNDDNCIDTAASLAAMLRLMGASNICVSMSWRGAVLVDEHDIIHYAKAPAGNIVCSVGAGDATVAGFLAEYIKTQDYENALKFGISAGSAACFTNGPAKYDDIIKIYKNMK